MASTVKNMKSMPKSYFYTDDSVKSITKHEGKMSDNFYKEAAAEVVRDAAGKKVEGVQQPATLGSHMSSPEIPEAESEVTPESPVPESTPASPAPASEAPQEQPAHPVVEDTPDDGFDDFDDFDVLDVLDDVDVLDDGIPNDVGVLDSTVLDIPTVFDTPSPPPRHR